MSNKAKIESKIESTRQIIANLEAKLQKMHDELQINIIKVKRHKTKLEELLAELDEE